MGVPYKLRHTNYYDLLHSSLLFLFLTAWKLFRTCETMKLRIPPNPHNTMPLFGDTLALTLNVWCNLWKAPNEPISLSWYWISQIYFYVICNLYCPSGTLMFILHLNIVKSNTLPNTGKLRHKNTGQMSCNKNCNSIMNT